jgi:hypothetical protein
MKETACKMAESSSGEWPTISCLLIVFFLSLDIQGDRSKLKCLICDQVLEVDEENQSELVYDHFQSHPAELQKILWEKSQRKGFFSGFIYPPFFQQML